MAFDIIVRKEMAIVIKAEVGSGWLVMEFAIGVAGSFPWQTFTLKLHDPDFIIK
jgi:hypothetical protein